MVGVGTEISRGAVAGAGIKISGGGVLVNVGMIGVGTEISGSGGGTENPGGCWH